MQRSITSKPDQASSRRGFTIVELLIVIVVIGILAAITIVGYSGITARAKVVAMQSDLAHLNEAIQLYHADNGSYPDSTSCAGTGWCGYNFAIGDNFIPGIAPKYMNTTPQQPTNAAGTGNGYLYRAPGGTDYKLIRLYPGGLPDVEKQQPALLDGCHADRWGYWSSDITKCW